METVAAVDHAQIAAQETHNVAIVVHLYKPNCLPSKGLANENKVAAPFDFAAAPHAADLVVGVVPGLVQVFGKATG